MTDRELLELAAKAAGIAAEWREVIRGRVAEFKVIKYTKHYGFYVEGKEWNPLIDDGDALRLAVKLKLWIQINDRCSWAQQDSENILGESAASSMAMHSETNNDPYAATRRAIVRAAAEMAKEMK